MSAVLHTTPDPGELFKTNLEAAGLDASRAPAAVQMALKALSEGSAPFVLLLGDLPASSRAWAYMACAFSAYAQWCEGTVVADDQPTETRE